jgi:hypothetical protein
LDAAKNRVIPAMTYCAPDHHQPGGA